MHGKMMMMMKVFCYICLGIYVAIVLVEYFSFSDEIKNFIFEDFNIHGPAGLVGVSCIFFTITVMLEGLKSLLLYIGLRVNQKTLVYNTSVKARYLFSGSLLHAVDIFLAYLVMLAVMSYNAYITIAVVVGSGFGHFICGAINANNRARFSEAKFGIQGIYDSRAEITTRGSNINITKY